MAVRSSLAEDVNSGPRVDENVEIHTKGKKDKQPKSTEADGKEKKQAFESRKLEIIVDVNEDGEIISTSTANQEFTDPPGVVYEYWAEVKARESTGKTCETEFENIQITTDPLLVEQGSESYSPLITRTNYWSPDNGVIREKMIFGPEISSKGKSSDGHAYINNRALFAVWNTQYIDNENKNKIIFTVTGDIIGCGIASFGRKISKTINVISPSFYTTVSDDVEKVDDSAFGVRIEMTDLYEKYFHFYLHSYVPSFYVSFKEKESESENQVSYAFLQTFELESGVQLNLVEGSKTQLCGNGKKNVLDANPENPYYPLYDKIITVPSDGDMHEISMSDSPGFRGSTCWSASQEGEKLKVLSYSEIIRFSAYLMMRVGTPPLEGKWEQDHTNWIPLGNILWSLTLKPTCTEKPQDSFCTDDNQWDLLSYSEVTQQHLPKYVLPSWETNSRDLVKNNNRGNDNGGFYKNPSSPSYFLCHSTDSEDCPPSDNYLPSESWSFVVDIDYM